MKCPKCQTDLMITDAKELRLTSVLVALDDARRVTGRLRIDGATVEDWPSRIR